MKKEETEKGFKVEDKRIFDDKGNVRDGSAAEAPEKATETPPPRIEEPAAQRPPERNVRAPSDEGEFEKIDFTKFFLSLASSALINLGEIEDPISRRKSVNIQGAR